MPAEVTMTVCSLLVRLVAMSRSFLVREKVEILIGVSPLPIFDTILCNFKSLATQLIMAAVPLHG